MGDKTGIAWTTSTWNPVSGCSKVSPGCENCYAERDSHRFGRTRLPWTKANAKENIQLHPTRLDQPLRWTTPRRIFVNSMSDLFAEEVPRAFIAQIFAVMAIAEDHTFQVLTKRAPRMQEVLSSREFVAEVASEVGRYASDKWPCLGHRVDDLEDEEGWPLPNVWMGVSVEDQRRADERIPHLLRIPSAVHWLSCEPLLEAVDLKEWLLPSCGAGAAAVLGDHLCSACHSFKAPLNWVVVGGESGARARPMDNTWALNLKAQCLEAGVPFFFKQAAGPRSGMNPYITEPDGSRWRWQQYPGELAAPEEV